jgi:cysteine desulfurase
MNNREVYLDHNATTPLSPAVADAMLACERDGWGNPASAHYAGRRARRLLEEAREGIASLLGANLQSAQPDSLIFTSGGTEANNLALLGLCGACAEPGRLIVSAIEHPSVVGPATELARRGWELLRAPVTPEGVVDLTWLPNACQSALRLSGPSPSSLVVSVMLGNNETGVLQPVDKIASLAHAAGARVHTDAVQVAGKLPINLHALDVDVLTLSAHKFHGPRGVGAVLLRAGVGLKPQLLGGFQQAGLRPGTESVALAVGMHEALRLAHRELQTRTTRMTALRERLEAGILAGFTSAVVHGGQVSRLPHTSNVSFPGLDRQALQMALDLAGVACSTGSACASGSTDPSPELIAMGCPDELLHSSLRFSVGATTMPAEVDQAVRHILHVCNDLRSQKQARNLALVGRNLN